MFTDTINPEVDVLYLCLGHGKSRNFLSSNSFSEKTLIVDLGNDFRLKEDCKFQGKTFIYGLPELQKEQIIEDLEKLKKEEETAGVELSKKYGNGSIDIDQGTFTKTG